MKNLHSKIVILIVNLLSGFIIILLNLHSKIVILIATAADVDKSITAVFTF